MARGSEKSDSLQIIRDIKKEKRLVSKSGIKSKGKDFVGRVNKLTDFIKSYRWKKSKS